MALKIKIEHNLLDIRGILNAANERAVKGALRRAVSRAGKHAKTETFKVVRDRRLVNLRSLKINDEQNRGKFVRLTDHSGNSVSSIFAELVFSDVRIGLAHFYSKKVAAGRSKLTGVRLYAVQFTVFGVTKTSSKAFIPSKNRKIVYARTGKDRLPIKKLFGPSVALLLKGTGQVEVVRKKAGERLVREFQSEFKKRIEGIISSRKK